MKNIIKILMERDGLSEEEASVLVDEAREAMHNYLMDGDMESASDICEEFFGLEPDYLESLI